MGGAPGRVLGGGVEAVPRLWSRALPGDRGSLELVTLG